MGILLYNALSTNFFKKFKENFYQNSNTEMEIIYTEEELTDFQNSINVIWDYSIRETTNNNILNFEVGLQSIETEPFKNIKKQNKFANLSTAIKPIYINHHELTNLEFPVDMSLQPSTTSGMQPSTTAGIQPSTTAGMQPSTTAGMQPSTTRVNNVNAALQLNPGHVTDLLNSGRGLFTSIMDCSFLRGLSIIERFIFLWI